MRRNTPTHTNGFEDSGFLDNRFGAILLVVGHCRLEIAETIEQISMQSLLPVPYAPPVS